MDDSEAEKGDLGYGVRSVLIHGITLNESPHLCGVQWPHLLNDYVQLNDLLEFPCRSKLCSTWIYISANSINQPCFRHCARHLTGETSINSHSMMYMLLSVFYRLGNESLEKLDDLHNVVQLVISKVFDLKSGLSDSKCFYFHLPLP